MESLIEMYEKMGISQKVYTFGEETLRKLTDHIESPEGATSMRLTHEDSKSLQSLAKEGKFDPERYDITLAEKADKIFICQNALKAGLNAALTSAILKAIPHIISAIKKMVEDGYIEENPEDGDTESDLYDDENIDLDFEPDDDMFIADDGLGDLDL